MKYSFQNSTASARQRASVCKWGGLAILALLAAIALPSMAAHPESLLCLGAMGFIPLGKGSMRFFDKPDDGGVSLTVEEKEELLGGVKNIRKQVTDQKSDFDNYQKETKQALEDFRKARDDDSENNNTRLQKLEKVLLQLGRERSLAHGDPRQRIIQDEEMNLRLNASIRQAVGIKLHERFTKALGEDSSPGSTYINDTLAKSIYDLLASYGVWNTFDVEATLSKIEKIPVDTADPVAQVILTEGDPITDDENMAGTSVSNNMEVIAVLLNVSLQLLQDSEYDLAGRILTKFQRAYNYRLDYLALRADGTADAANGGMTGLFNFGTAAAAAPGNTTVESMDLEDWTRCQLTPAVAVNDRDARWWLHRHMLIRALSIKDNNGRPIFLTAQEAPSAGSVGTILGAPLTLANAAPNTNTAGSPVAAYGDPMGLHVGVRKDFVFEASDHHRWTQLQRSFRGWGRAGVKGKLATAFGILKNAAA